MTTTPPQQPQQGFTTLTELVDVRADEDPSGVCYRFLHSDPDRAATPMPHSELQQRARRLAARLQQTGVAAGDRTVLLVPPGPDYVISIFACQYAGSIAVPLYPPDLRRIEATMTRMMRLMTDARPRAVIATSDLCDLVDPTETPDITWLAIDASVEEHPDLQPVHVQPTDVAILQYTSGSTAHPKGVRLTHSNLLHNSALIQSYFNTSADTRAMVWLPPYHDMGLIGGLLQPLYANCAVTLLSPLDFLADPLRWIRSISADKITASGGPNFAYELCCTRAHDADLSELDLSSWQIAFNGAEPIRPATLDRFTRTFGPYGFDPHAFLPCYGLAEATLIVSGSGGLPRVDPTSPPYTTICVDATALTHGTVEEKQPGPHTRELTSCGTWATSQDVIVVNPTTQLEVPSNTVGEVWVHGPSVADGYWQQPEASRTTFDARTADDGRSWLRTGDLGFIHDHALYITGRLKDVLIVRGANHYPQDLELTCEQTVPQLRAGSGAAFTVPNSHTTDDIVAIAYEVRRTASDFDPRPAAQALRAAIAREHGVTVGPIAFVRQGTIPKTSSGKIRRRACQQQFLDGRLEEIARSDSPTPAAVPAPASPTEDPQAYLRHLIGSLGASPDAPTDSPLMATGLDSLGLTQLRSRIAADTGVDIPISFLLAASLDQVISRIQHQPRDASAPSEAANPTDAPPTTHTRAADTPAATALPLTPQQERIWYLHQFDPSTPQYNLAIAVQFLDPIDPSTLRRGLDALVDRHASLRARFPICGDAPQQTIDAKAGAHFATHSQPYGAAVPQIAATIAAKPFDLENGPLFRCDLIATPQGQLAVLTAHHMIADFWSMAVLVNDLSHLLDAKPTTALPGLPTPTQITRWQQQQLADPRRVAVLERYWDHQLANGLPALPMPQAPGEGPGFARLTISPETLTRLRAAATAGRTTLFVILLAAWNATLMRSTAITDVAVGTNLAGRFRPELDGVVGCLTNTVVVRSKVTPNATFNDVLHATHTAVFGALDHSEYPMAHLSRRYHAKHSSPLVVPCLFTFNAPTPHQDATAARLSSASPHPGTLGRYRVQALPIRPPAVGLPLEVVVTDTREGLHATFRWAQGHQGTQMTAMAQQWAELLKSLAEHDQPWQAAVHH